MAEPDPAPDHPVTTPGGAAGFAVLVGLAGVFAPVFLDAKGAIVVGLMAAAVIGWIYWREGQQAWRERRWHAGLVLPAGFLLIVIALTAATAQRLAQGGKDENVPVLSAIANLKRDVDSKRAGAATQPSIPNTKALPPPATIPASPPVAGVPPHAPHSATSAPGAVLVRVDVDRLMDYGNYPGITIRAVIINNTSESIVVQSLHLLEIDYLDSSMEASLHGIENFDAAATEGGMRFPSSIFFPGETSRLQRSGVLETFFDPSAVYLDGVAIGGPVTLSGQRVSQITAQFPTRVVDRKATNAIAAGLMFDIITPDGNIDRRICPEFFSIVVLNPMGVGGTIFGPIGRQPATLWPPQKDTPLCALASAPSPPRAPAPSAPR
jgi:hypothetical protein